MCVHIILYRYNLNILEEWVRENGLMEEELMDGSVISMLHPMIQASKLLQMKKQSFHDAEEIISLCTCLTGNICNNYTTLIRQVSVNCPNSIKMTLRSNHTTSLIIEIFLMLCMVGFEVFHLF